MRRHSSHLILGTILLGGCTTSPSPTPQDELPARASQQISPEEREQRLIDAKFIMIRMCMAFNSYNLNYDGPPAGEAWHQDLVDEGLSNAEDLISPATDHDEVEYVLVPATEITFDRQQILVYEDPDHHLEQVVVMFHDLHAESISRVRFEQLAAEQGFEIVK